MHIAMRVLVLERMLRLPTPIQTHQNESDPPERPAHGQIPTRPLSAQTQCWRLARLDLPSMLRHYRDHVRWGWFTGGGERSLLRRAWSWRVALPPTSKIGILYRFQAGICMRLLIWRSGKGIRNGLSMTG